MVLRGSWTRRSATNTRTDREVWRYFAGVIALAAAISLAGCYGAPLSPRESDTLIGGAVGAGGGALVGSAVGSPGAGAAIGGLGGAGLGYLIGNQVQNQYGYGYGYGRHDRWRGEY
jgi:osmotically inducible lipoprotein OsmB